MVTVDSGKVEASNKFREVPKSKWKSLVRIKRDFLSVQISYDCRCLIEFCEEAEEVYAELGYASSEQMIRDGYELDPSQIELAIAWLNTNGMDRPVPMAEAIEPLAKHGGDRKSEDYQVDNVNLKTKGGNDTEYTLRRLARDCPEMLDKIEAGELSVNAAAIQAGIRKKPTPEEQCRAAFMRCSDQRAMLKELQALVDRAVDA